MRVTQRFTQVDAFTDRPFTGNPAAVCLLQSPADPVWMQQVAREMNLAETAFLRRQNDGYDLRWFTPSTEVDLCGHATLASAHVLWEEQQLGPNDTARFHTRSGLLTASREEASSGSTFLPHRVNRQSPPGTSSTAWERRSNIWAEPASTIWSRWSRKPPCAGSPPTSPP